MILNNNQLNRSGTVVKRTVEYRSPLFGEDMPRKSLDIRFPDYPISAGKGQLRLLLPSVEDRSGRRPEIKLRWGMPEWRGALLEGHPQERTADLDTQKPQQMPGLMFQLFWDIFKNA